MIKNTMYLKGYNVFSFEVFKSTYFLKEYAKGQNKGFYSLLKELIIVQVLRPNCLGWVGKENK